MNFDQNKHYHVAVARAHEALHSQLDLTAFRREEDGYALGVFKSSTLFDPFEISKVFVHYWALAGDLPGCDGQSTRLTVDEIARRAIGRLQFSGKTLRQWWDLVESKPRLTTMWPRFKIKLFEELVTFPYDELVKVYFTLKRLGREYPAGARKQDACATNTEEEAA
jgi:hypothetical protein